MQDATMEIPTMKPVVKYDKPICPHCGRGNVRFRTTPEFKDIPFRCNICGHVWKV